MFGDLAKFSLPRKKVGFTDVFIFLLQFHLLLNVAVGGTSGFFAEGQYDVPKSWRNDSPHPMRDFWEHRGEWLKTWHGDDVAMLIDYVEMIQY